jgi:Ca2+-binding RTX toxin-like protein
MMETPKLVQRVFPLLFAISLLGTALAVPGALATTITVTEADADTSLGGNSCKGTNGDDVLMGTNGDDMCVGRKGNDVIHMLGGNDIGSAGRGNDTINCGAGKDEAYGGPGTDTLNQDCEIAQQEGP